MSVTRLVDSHGGPSDGLKHRRSIRLLVSTPPDGVGPELQAAGYIEGTSYPNNPAFGVLDSFETEPVIEVGGKQSIVTAIYTNDRTGRLNPRPDRTHPAFKTWEVSFVDRVSEIPYVFTFPMKDIGSGAVSVTPGEELRKFQSDETDVVYQRSVVIQSLGYAEITAIKEQINAIHVYQGVAIRMTKPIITRTETNAYEVTYSWEADDGTPPITEVLETGAVIPWNGTHGIGPAALNRFVHYPPALPNQLRQLPPPFATVGSPDATYTRSPFCSIEVYLLGNGEPPQFTHEIRHKIDRPEGWQTLPGFPLQ